LRSFLQVARNIEEEFEEDKLKRFVFRSESLEALKGEIVKSVETKDEKFEIIRELELVSCFPFLRI